MSGIEIMSTTNIRQRIMQSPIADKIEGISGRWTFFTQLFSKDDKETKIAANYLAIDSKQELKVGIGRLFDSKKTIGEK